MGKRISKCRESVAPVSVFDYTDFRKFLCDQLAAKKKINRIYTYRYIAAQAGFKSAGLLTQIIQGKTALSERIILKLTEILGLNQRESRYFGFMVRFNQAQSHTEKRDFFEHMTSFKSGQVKTLDPGEFEFYDKWYYSAIRALLQYYAFNGDYAELAHMLVPAITASEAKKAVAILEKLGFVCKNVEDRYVLTNKHITTGLSTESVIVNNFVTNTLDIAKDALYAFAKEERSFSALTLGVSQQGYEKIKSKIDSFRSELVEIVKQDQEIDRVYQVNFQLFPLTTTKRRPV